MQNPTQSSGIVLWQVANLWQREFKKVLKPLGLTHVQFVVLSGIKELASQGPASQADVAHLIGADVMMFSTVVRALEARKLITRKKSEIDTRLMLVELTESGRELHAEANELVEEFDREFFGPSAESMIRMLSKVLGK